MLSYSEKTFEVLSEQAQAVKGDYNVALKGFVLLRDILEKASQTKLAYERVLEVEEEEREATDKVLIAKAGVNKAEDANWRSGKEFVLYLFGFKWLWGAFTGYASSTSTSLESKTLEKQKEEAKQIQLRNSELFPKLIKEFEKRFRQTLELVQQAKSWFDKDRSFSESLGSFEEGFKNIFLERDFNRAEFQRVYRLFSQELMQGREFYYSTGLQKSEEYENRVQPAPSIVKNLLETKRFLALTSINEN